MVQRWIQFDRILVAIIGLALLSIGLHAQVREPEPVADESADIAQMLPAEIIDSLNAAINADFETIKPILKESCFDCHSTATVYPWYHSLPIVKGFMDGHIEEGLEHLDMSAGFPFNKGEGDQLHVLEEMKEEIEKGDMPIFSYRMLHWGALIEGEEQDSVFAWIDRTTERLNGFYAKYPALKDVKKVKDEAESEADEH